jgi:hypothetical protein
MKLEFRTTEERTKKVKRLAGKTVFARFGVSRSIIFGAAKTQNNRRLLDAEARLLRKDGLAR